MGVEDDEMKRRKHTPEQIVRKLREADRLIGQGASVAEVLQHLEVTEATYYRWRNQYGAMGPDEAKRLKELEVENARLKKLLAEAELDKALVNVMAVAENYPDLKASTNFLDLQRQLADTENQLAFARQYYNDSVSTLNKLVATMPWMFFAGMANVQRRAFYQAPAGQTTPPTVSF